MALLVRKIDKGKWMQNDILRGEPISADAITNCLKTKQNMLSMWRIADRHDVDDVVLAQASMFDHLDSIDVVILDEGSLRKRGIHIEDAPGGTRLADLADAHVHASGLDIDLLCELATTIADSLRSKNEQRYEKGTLARLLASAISEERLQLEELNEHVAERVRKVLDATT